MAAETQRSALQPAAPVAPVAPLATTRSAAAAQQLAATAPDAIASSRPVFSSTLNGAFRLDQYHRLEEIYAFMDALAAAHKNRVRVFTIGRTNERRPIKALELVNNATDLDFVWLDALTHAREWITGSTLLYTLDKLVAQTGAPVQSLVHSKNYIVVPVVNPDGYAYTWTTNRMWRKNRSRHNIGGRSGAQQCFGVSDATDSPEVHYLMRLD